MEYNFIAQREATLMSIIIPSAFGVPGLLDCMDKANYIG
jgi:hypothetical protein